MNKNFNIPLQVWEVAYVASNIFFLKLKNDTTKILEWMQEGEYSYSLYIYIYTTEEVTV